MRIWEYISQIPFSKGMQVSAPNIFATEIDLNIERNKIVKHLQPTIRVTYRTNKENYLLDGLLVVNFNLDYLLSQIKSYNQEGTLISILNHDGFWLLNSDANLVGVYGSYRNKVEQAINKSVRLSVSDNGKGVNNDTKADIFEPFYTTARGKGNTGLGLYMVYQWVTQVLKGEIKLHSEPQSDTYFKTQFIITLPDLTANSHYD